MINYNRFNKDYYTTVLLQEQLAHCIGKSTVEIFKATVNGHNAIAIYHYNALIAVWDIEQDIVYCNYYFYDYSGCTSRVRNAFIRYCLGDMYASVPTTKQLQRIEKTGECLTVWNTTIVVDKVESDRQY